MSRDNTGARSLLLCFPRITDVSVRKANVGHVYLRPFYQPGQCWCRRSPIADARKPNAKRTFFFLTHHVPGTEYDRPRPDMAASATSGGVEALPTRFELHVVRFFHARDSRKGVESRNDSLSPTATAPAPPPWPADANTSRNIIDIHRRDGQGDRPVAERINQPESFKPHNK